MKRFILCAALVVGGFAYGQEITLHPVGVGPEALDNQMTNLVRTADTNSWVVEPHTGLVETNDTRNVSLSGTVSVGKYDNYQVPTELFTVNGTCTVSRTDGFDVGIILTNNTTFAMADDWSTNGVGRVALAIENGLTFSATFPTSQFYWVTAPSITADTAKTLYFNRGWRESRWEIR